MAGAPVFCKVGIHSCVWVVPSQQGFFFFLKPENIAVSEYAHIKVLDFGQAVDIADGIPVLKVPRGTMPFVAPEVMRLSTQWDPMAGDLWQLGVIFFEILCGNHSFVKFMDWRKRNLSSIPECLLLSEELKCCFDEAAKTSTMAEMSQMHHVSSPSSTIAMKLLSDLLEFTPAMRFPARCVKEVLDEDLCIIAKES